MNDSPSIYVNGFSLGILESRPKTGEEARLMFYTPLLLGSKGLSYWQISAEPTGIGNDNTFGTVYLGPLIRDTVGLTPDSMIYSTRFMGDYFRHNSHPVIDTIIKRNAMSRLDSVYNLTTMNIDSNHIYIGPMSTRAETSKLFKWISSVEDTLINLRLVSAYYKGANRLYSQDPMIAPDTLMRYFLKFDSVKTRRFDSTAVEPDSQKYVFLSLFAYGNDTLRPNSRTFYLGVLNPRTDPLVRTFDTIRNEQGEILFIDSSMKFYSTAEYDIGVRYGNYTHIWNPSTSNYQWRDTSYWQSLWWRRQGAREIRIPLKVPMDELLCSCGYPAHYTVRVTELGASDTNLNKEFWRDPRYYHRVDTTLYGYAGGENYYSPWLPRDYTLKVRLLPGEGKILRVTISHECPSLMTGLMLPISQIKIVTHPIGRVQQWRRDSVYHHLVYYRKDTLTGRSKVYYRRSLPLYPDSTIIPKLEWSPEICLSDSIRCWREPERVITNADCGYPSLVVRYDSISEETKVYVTFVCRDSDSLTNFNDCFYSNEPRYNCPNSNYTVIAECIINADAPIQNIPPSQAIHWACGDDVEVWGVPVVNASRYGNYYVWADSVWGIVASYKRPWQTEFPIGFNFNMSSFKFNTNGIAMNPSLTSYSRIFYNEDGTPIVWQEKSNDNGFYNIYYSLLKVDTTGLFVRHYLPSGVGNNNPGFVFNTDSSIVELGLGTELAELPVVYRDVKDSLQAPGPGQILDLVAWGAQRTDTVPNCRFIRTITLQHFINNGEIMTTSIKPRVALHTDYVNFNLRYPVLSQGSSGSVENHQGPAILETIVEDSCPNVANFDKKVLHIPYDYFIAESPYSELIHSGASLVQLSRRPFVSIQNDWWQNLRLLQKDTSIAEFCASTRKFWRRRDEEPKPFVFFGFCNANSVTSFSNIALDGKYLKWDTESIFPELDSVLKYKFIPFTQRNTFSTEWFQVKDLSRLNFIVNKTSDNPFSVILERQSDRRRSNLPIGLGAGFKVRNLAYQLLNRTPEEKYRVIIAQNDSGTQFCQEIILMPDPFAEENSPKGTDSDVPVFDLGSMEANANYNNDILVLVYPNPAVERVYVTAFLPVEYLKENRNENLNREIQIFNSIGNKIYETTALSGKTVVLPTSALSVGLHYIIAATTKSYELNPRGSASVLIYK